MILEQGENTNLQKEGTGDSVKMNISLSEDVQSHIIKVLTETYKYPVKSIIRENFSNHWDSHYENGNIDEPISVKLYRLPTWNWMLETEDRGLGLSEEGFYKYYMGIGESTKRDKPKLIGGYGLGCKSSLAYSKSYEVICRKDGVENKFLIFKGGDRPEATKIHTKDTTEPNGLIVKVPVDRWDFSKFQIAIKEQLCYFPTALINIEGDGFNYSEARIFENDLFIWSEIYPNSQMHISFNNCNYPIDWELLGIKAINIPVGIKIPVDSGITPQFNREALQYTAFTKKYILDKIKEIATYFVERYNTEWKSYTNIRDAWGWIGDENKLVEIAGQEFEINDLFEYTNLKPLELAIDNIKLNTPEFYKGLDILNEYTALIDYKQGKWIKKHVSYIDIVDKSFDNYKIIQVDKVPTARLKKYLLEKYRGNILFVKKTQTRKLGRRESSLQDDKDYRYLLELTLVPKEEWRGRITEYQEYVEKVFKNYIIDERELENTGVYQAWLAEYKEKMKNNRSNYGGSGNYKILNKQKGEVTLAVYTKGARGYKFEKTTFDIQSLRKTPKLTICFTEEERDKAYSLGSICGKKWNIVIAGKNEAKKIVDIHNHLTFKQFMDSQPFKKLMSSLLFEKEITKFEDLLGDDGQEIVKNILKPLQKNIDILQEYVNQNGKRVNNELLDMMIGVAEENKLYDYSLWDIYENCKKQIEKYDFLTMLKTSDSWDEIEVKRYTKLVNSILVQKIKNKEIEDLEYSILPKPEAEVVSATSEEIEELVTVD